MPRSAPIHRPQRVSAPKYNARGNEATNRQRKRAMHTGSKGWKLQRQRVLLRDHYTCQWPRCGCYGDQVDHKHDNAHEVVDDSQLWTLCIHHHSEKTMRALNATRGR